MRMPVATTNARTAKLPVRARLLMLSFLPLLSWFSDCNCNGKPPVNTGGVCARDVECPKGQTFRKGQCVTERCDARKIGDADCCPGQTCRLDGVCADKKTLCTTDSQCGDGGRVCLDRTELSTESKVCSWPIPDAQGVCPSTYRKFNQRCVKDLPCGGGCADDQLCNIETDECEAVPVIPQAKHNCDVTCAAGTMKTLANPDAMTFGQCCAVSCQCEALPPIAVGVYSRYVDGAVASNEIMASAYSSTYGDLVLAHFEKTSGKISAVEFIDGVPATGKIAGKTDGPRNGLSDPGPNVGLFTSLVVGTDGAPRIAYYDADNKDLKYAEKTSGGWVIHVIDTQGDVGQFAEMQLIDGKLRVAYLVLDGQKIGQTGADTQSYTTLRYAEANSQSPRSASDWTRLDAVTPQPVRSPCGGQCNASQKCVYDTTLAVPAKACATAGAKVCASPADTNCCAGTAVSGQVCVTSASGQSAFLYEDPLTVTAMLPAGIGLFPTMQKQGSGLMIAYHDTYSPPSATPPFVVNNGTLKGVVGTFSGSSVTAFSAPTVLDSGAACSGPARSVGSFANLSVSSTGRLGVVYSDATRGELRMFAPPVPQGFSAFSGCFPDAASSFGAVHIVDNGISQSGGVSLVGADASLYFDSNGKGYIAYQEQSTTDIKLAVEQPSGQWVAQTLSEETGGGFEIQFLPDADKLWLLSATVGFDAVLSPTDTLKIREVSLP